MSLPCARNRVLPAGVREADKAAPKRRNPMEYGIRHYEAAQRLLWLMVFIISLGLAYLIKGSDAYQRSYPVPTVGTLKTADFWLELQGLQIQPPGTTGARATTQGGSDFHRTIQAAPGILAGIMIYLILLNAVFLGLRAVWLLVQLVGKSLIQILLKTHVKKPVRRQTAALDSLARHMDRFFTGETLAKEVNRFPLPFVFHPFKRLKLLLSQPQATLSAEELTEKDRRIAETDWQILWQSWLPFNWVFWTLPVLALLQSSSLFYVELLPIFSGKRELAEFSTPLLTGLIPLFQVVVISAVLKLASTLLKRIDELYLANLDALFYDEFIARLPLHSADTLILLQTMQRQFMEIQSALRRLERSLPVHGTGEETGKERKKLERG